MAKVIFALLATLCIAFDSKLAGQEVDAEIVFEIVSGKDKGRPFIEYRFIDGGCVFWEYFRGNAYQGSLSDEKSRYKISSLVFSFEYPRPYSSYRKYQGEESLAKYQGVTYISIGGKKLKAHKFLVFEGVEKQAVYLSDSYVMPLGYDTSKVKVRITKAGLENLEKIKCES